jgi:YYY domain-containing protein
MATSAVSQIAFLFEWIILLFLFQVSLWHPLRSISKTFALPLSFPVSLLCVTLVTWYLALVSLPVFLFLILFIFLLGYVVVRKMVTLSDLKEGWRWYLIFYGVFILALIVKLWYNSSIDISYEKLMDSMILSSIVLSPHLPPTDAWFAGGSLTWYYYLGAWMFAVPAHVFSIPAPVMYNLVIPTVFAASAVMIFSCSILILERFRFLPLLALIISYPGFFTLIPVALSDNTPFRYILDGSTRLLPGAVTENPLSALFIGSPRPYAIAMFIQCLVIFLFMFISLQWKDLDGKGRLGVGLILALSLGTLIPLHTWDLIIYLPLTVFVGLLTSYRIFGMSGFFEDRADCSLLQRLHQWLLYLRASAAHIREFARGSSGSAFLMIAFIAPILTFLVYLPFLLELDNKRMQGVTLSLFASDPLPFFLVHGLFLIILIVFLRGDIIKNPLVLIIPFIIAICGFISASLVLIPALYLILRRFGRIEEVLAFSGLMCILFCEFFTMVQNGVPDRSNTTYKFYFTAWILLGISTFILTGEAARRSSFFTTPFRYHLATGLILCAAFIFPAILLSGGPLWSPSIDGTAFVRTYIGDEEANALAYLSSLPAGEVVVEGVVPVGDEKDVPIKYFSRISAYTGIPAVMGSYMRELVFRGENETRERGEDSILIYLKPEKALELMAKHNATILYVGVPEISLYQIHDPGMYSSYGFTPVFQENLTTIWRAPVTS